MKCYFSQCVKFDYQIFHSVKDSYHVIIRSCSYEDDNSDSDWLYSCHPATAVCRHALPPCRNMTVICPSCQHERGQHRPVYHGPPTSSHPPAAALLPGPASIDHQQSSETGEHSSTEDGPSSDVAASSVTCDLDFYTVEYVMKSQTQRVDDIEQQFGVAIKSVNRVCEEIVTVAFQRYNPTIQPENEEQARRAFLALYESAYKLIVQRTVRAKIDPPMTASSLLSAISNVYKERIFASTNPDGVFTLVGPFEEVSAVENFILKRNAGQSDAERPRARDRGKSQQVDEREELWKAAGGSGSSAGGCEGPMSVFEVGGQLTVKVYSADITELPLDVIVNAANEHLQNYAGVAGAIERAGGEELRQDCEVVVDQGGPLRV